MRSNETFQAHPSISEEQPVYTIGTISELIGEHPETLRVWERRGLIHPNRAGSHRKYSNQDLLRLRFIKELMEDKGLNIAGVLQVTGMYTCWDRKTCKGGSVRNSSVPVNVSKPCWKLSGTFCLAIEDKSEFCQSCEMVTKCVRCQGCR